MHELFAHIFYTCYKMNLCLFKFKTGSSILSKEFESTHGQSNWKITSSGYSLCHYAKIIIRSFANNCKGLLQDKQRGSQLLNDARGDTITMTRTELFVNFTCSISLLFAPDEAPCNCKRDFEFLLIQYNTVNNWQFYY